MALTTLGAIAGGWLALAGLLWLLQPYLLFQPAAGGTGVTRTPADVGLEYEIVPFGHARRLAAIRPPVVELVELTGGHNDAFLASWPGYTRTLARFIARVTGADGHAR